MSTGLAAPDQTRMKQPGPGVGQPARRQAEPAMQEPQEFDSWRHQTHQPGPQQGFNPMSSMASDPYLSSFYAGSYHYPGFGVGEGECCCHPQGCTDCSLQQEHGATVETTP